MAGIRRLESISFYSNTSKLSETERRAVKETFHMFDRNGDGQIDRSDLQIVLRAVLQQETTDQQIQMVLSMLDKKRTGKIGLPEFWFVMESWIADNKEAQGRSARAHQTPQSERKHIHEIIKAFFTQVKLDVTPVSFQTLVGQEADPAFQDILEYDIDGRFEAPLTQNQKLQALRDSKECLRNGTNILQALASSNPQYQLDGMKWLSKMLSVLDAFKSPLERSRLVAETLISIFEFIQANLLVSRIVAIVKMQSHMEMMLNIRMEALRIFTYIAPGPQIAFTPPESPLHPDQMFFKVLLFSESAVGLIVECLTSSFPDLRDQAALALSVIAAHTPRSRDHLITNGIMDKILAVAMDLFNAKDQGLRKVAWCIFTLCSKANSEDPGPPRDRIIPYLKPIASLLFSSDRWVLRHTCNALFNVLPGFPFNDVCRRMLQLTGQEWQGFPDVQSSALKTISNIIRYDDAQTQIFLREGLVGNIHALLYHTNNDIRVDACDALILLVGLKGEIQPLIQSNIIPTLLKQLHTDDFTRWKLVKVIKYMARGTPSQVAALVNGGCIKELCSCLSNFKEFDEVLTEVYQYYGPTFDFELVVDILSSLHSIVLTSDMIAEETKSRSEFSLKFDFASMEKIKGLIQAIHENKADIGGWHQSSGLQQNEIEDVIKSLLFRLKRAFDLAPSEMSYLMSKLISDIWQQYFSENIVTEEQESKTVIFKCLLEGEVANRLIEITREKLSFEALLAQIKDKYQKTLIVAYKDDEGDLVTIDDQKSFQKALEKFDNKDGAVTIKLILIQPTAKKTKREDREEDNGDQATQEVEDEKDDQSQNNKRRKVEQEDSVSDTTPPALSPTISLPAAEADNIPFAAVIPTAWLPVTRKESFKEDLQRVKQSEKNLLLTQLEQTTHFGKEELETLYEFWKKKEDQNGAISTKVFEEGLRAHGVKDPLIIEQNISAFDINNTGKIHFRDFVTGLSAIQRGTVDERLRFVFRMYDTDKSGKLSEEEIYKIFEASLASRGEPIVPAQIKDMVKKCISQIDQDNDGQLDFEEFKHAVMSQKLIVNCAAAVAMPSNPAQDKMKDAATKEATAAKQEAKKA